MEPLNCLGLARARPAARSGPAPQFQTSGPGERARGQRGTQGPSRSKIQHALPRRRLRPARACQSRTSSWRLSTSRSAAGAPRQDDLDAGGRSPRRLLSPDVEFGPQRRARRGGKPVAWSAYDRRPVRRRRHPVRGATIKDGVDRTSVEGAAELPAPCPPSRVDLHSPKSRGAGALVALRRAHPYRLRGGELHRRAGAGRRQGPLPVPPRAARPATPSPGRARPRRAAGGLGHAAARWASARGIAVHPSFGSLVRSGGGGLAQRQTPIAVHRVVVRDRLRPRRQSPRPSARRWRAASSSASRRRLYGQITLKQGASSSRNFHDYPVLRIGCHAAGGGAHRPEHARRPSGIGEPGTPLHGGGAVQCALHASTGRRASGCAAARSPRLRVRLRGPRSLRTWKRLIPAGLLGSALVLFGASADGRADRRRGNARSRSEPSPASPRCSAIPAA